MVILLIKYNTYLVLVHLLIELMNYQIYTLHKLSMKKTFLQKHCIQMTFIQMFLNLTCKKGSLIPETSCSGEYPDMMRFFRIRTNWGTSCRKERCIKTTTATKSEYLILSLQ